MLVTVNLNLTRINECVSEVSGSKSGSNENGNGSEVVPGALKSGSTTSKISGNPVFASIAKPIEKKLTIPFLLIKYKHIAINH